MNLKRNFSYTIITVDSADDIVALIEILKNHPKKMSYPQTLSGNNYQVGLDLKFKDSEDLQCTINDLKTHVTITAISTTTYQAYTTTQFSSALSSSFIYFW